MTTTTTTKTAIDYAREIAAEMSGWRLNVDTRHAEPEGDTFTPHSARLGSEQYPGAELRINIRRKDGKLSISANYPNDYTPYIEGRGRVWREQIGVSLTKTPAQVAKDIMRRLFEATGYLARVAECMARKQQTEDGQRRAVELAERLATIAGSRTLAQRGRDYGPGASHLVTGEHARKFTAWPNTSGTRAEVEVSHGGRAVTIELTDLSPDFAERVLRLWWEYQQQIERQS